jgi:hypothetical protein
MIAVHQQLEHANRQGKGILIGQPVDGIQPFVMEFGGDKIAFPDFATKKLTLMDELKRVGVKVTYAARLIAKQIAQMQVADYVSGGMEFRHHPGHVCRHSQAKGKIDLLRTGSRIGDFFQS